MTKSVSWLKVVRQMHHLLDLFHKIYDVQGLVRFGGLAALAAVIFAETGLLVGFFLPGDSLLVTAGLFCTSANGETPLLNIVTLILAATVAAIVGDTVGYWIGAKSGPRIFSREQSLLFSRKHLLRTKEFYERHGGKTIIIARFMPFLRTFAPVVAGRRADELPPVRQLQRLRRHRLGGEHDDARVLARQASTRGSPSRSTRWSSSSSPCR